MHAAIYIDKNNRNVKCNQDFKTCESNRKIYQVRTIKQLFSCIVI